MLGCGWPDGKKMSRRKKKKKKKNAAPPKPQSVNVEWLEKWRKEAAKRHARRAKREECIEIQRVRRYTGLGYGWPDGLRMPKNHKTRTIRRLRLEKWREWPYCHYCEQPLEWHETTLDHVIPVSAGGETSWENTEIACEECNTLKGSKLNFNRGDNVPHGPSPT